MAERLTAKAFVYGLESAWKRKDGYIMSSQGQDPKKWPKDSWWFTQYSGKQREKALYWREHAARVWDCNGLSEGLYKDFSGKDINTKARYNFANWCTTKGTGMIPERYRIPGAAVFWGDSASSIHHVAYLYKPTEDGKDWYLIEARGVMYGVVRTKLSERKPNFWGLMEKYFDYSEYLNKKPEGDTNVYTLGSRALKKGMSGEDVKQLQELLKQLGYDLEVDGVYGDKTAEAVYHFKKAHDVRNSSGEVNDVYGVKAHAALMQAIADDEEPVPETPVKQKSVIVYAAGSWNVRKGPGTNYGIVTVVKEGAAFPYISTADNGWIQVEINGGTGWLSPKCAEVTG